MRLFQGGNGEKGEKLGEKEGKWEREKINVRGALKLDYLLNLGVFF